MAEEKTTFTEKAKHIFETVKDKVTGHHHSNECQEPECNPEYNAECNPVPLQYQGGLEEDGQIHQQGSTQNTGIAGKERFM